jgi:DNA-binding XRE family transcriptional regulator
VAQARVDAGVAPAILAKAIGVTPAVLSGLEKGQVAFTREQALAAAKCLNLHPDDVLAIGGFAVESDNPQGNQHGDGSESSGKDSQGGFKLTR